MAHLRIYNLLFRFLQLGLLYPRAGSQSLQQLISHTGVCQCHSCGWAVSLKGKGLHGLTWRSESGGEGHCPSHPPFQNTLLLHLESMNCQRLVCLPLASLHCCLQAAWGQHCPMPAVRPSQGCTIGAKDALQYLHDRVGQYARTAYSKPNWIGPLVTIFRRLCGLANIVKRETCRLHKGLPTRSPHNSVIA